MTDFNTPTSRWHALQTRNPLASNAFIYSVLTTKNFCRPTCPSRLARRANIVFHSTPAEASAAGFRPCKRCRPELKEGEGDPQRVAVEKACVLVRGEGEKWSVKRLAEEVGLTESHFCRVFRKVTGGTVGEFRASLSARGAEDSLGDTAGTVPASGEQFPTLDLSGTLSSRERWGPALDFDCPELEKDWFEFSGVNPYQDLHIPLPMVDFDSEQSSPDHYSDFTNVDMMDDGFQFVDFGNVLSTKGLT